jgi:hypothetical protein
MPSQAYNDHFERNFRPVDRLKHRHAAGTAVFEIVTTYYERDGYLAGVLHTRQGWHYYFSARAPGGADLCGQVRGPFADEDSAMIAASAELEAGNQADDELAAGLKRDREELLAQRVQTAGHGRRARIQADIDKIERELERLDALD